MSIERNTRPRASLSLDLDNLWAYLRTQGDQSWKEMPSFLDLAIPRLRDFFATAGWSITIFVVGRDIEVTGHGALLESLVSAGHELGNHSYTHRIDFHRLDIEAVVTELETTEGLLESVGAPRPRGFRGPSFRLSPTVIEVLATRDYVYDASTFPTFIGPLARRFLNKRPASTAISDEGHDDVFGSWRDGLRPLKPYRWQSGSGNVLEIPVTTFPLARTPVHFTYVNFIADKSPLAAEAYFTAALTACRAIGASPSLLLHATDFIGSDDRACPRFLPGMKRTSDEKIRFLRKLLERYYKWFEVMPMASFATQADITGDLRIVDCALAG